MSGCPEHWTIQLLNCIHKSALQYTQCTPVTDSLRQTGGRTGDGQVDGQRDEYYGNSATIRSKF